MTAFWIVFPVVTLIGFGIPAFFRLIWPKDLLAEAEQQAFERGGFPLRPHPALVVIMLGIAAVFPRGRVSRVIEFSKLPMGPLHRRLSMAVGLCFFVFVCWVYIESYSAVIHPVPVEDVSGRVRVLYALEQAVCPGCSSGRLVGALLAACITALPVWLSAIRRRNFRWDARDGRYIRLDRNKKQRR